MAGTGGAGGASGAGGSTPIADYTGLLGLVAELLIDVREILNALLSDPAATLGAALTSAEHALANLMGVLIEDEQANGAALAEHLAANLSEQDAEGLVGDLVVDLGNIIGDADDVTLALLPQPKLPREFPWSEDFEHYVGSLHEHSAYSDGAAKKTPRDYFAAAKTLGLDFMGSTEHSDNADLPLALSNDCIPSENNIPPRTADCLNSDPQRPTDALRKWDATLEIARELSTDRFTAFRGFEWTSDRFGHINVFFSKHDVNAKTDGGYVGTLESFWTWFTRRPELGGGSDGLAAFNHPGREDTLHQVIPDPGYAFNQLALVPAAAERMVGIEVFGKGSFYDDGCPSDVCATPSWYAHALDQGWQLGPIGAEDEHGLNWAKPSLPKTVLIARDRSEGALREAMLSRRFYAVAQNHNNIRLVFNADGAAMGSRVGRSDGSNVLLHATVTAPAGIYQFELISNGGQVIASSLGTVLEHNVSAGSERWYFLRVKDAAGKPIAYSAPVWIRAGGAYPRRGEWVAGDLHAHSTYSHDSFGLAPGDDNSALDEAYTAGFSVLQHFANASLRGLDYLAVSDHNDIRSHTDPGFGAFGVLPIRSYENSLQGHAQMLGAREIYDAGDRSATAVTAMANELRADGGTFQINHPASGLINYPDDPHTFNWSYGYDVVPDTQEIWNVAWPYQPPFPAAAPNDLSLKIWEGWLDRGVKVGATGGSDSHWISTSMAQGPGQPSTWVFVTERSPRGVLVGLKAGRSFVADQPPLIFGPRLFLEADTDGDGVFEALPGDQVAPSARFRIRGENLLPGSRVRVVTSQHRTEAPLLDEGVAGLDFSATFAVPAGVKWLRAENLLPDLQNERQQLQPLCDVLGALGENGSPAPTATTYCRDRIGIRALTSAMYIEGFGP
ncbi:MAG: CehA/McbA family metallohydrolase [Nevskiales bacterium]